MSSSFSLNFSSSLASTIGDGSGLGTGLRDRLSGTGAAIGAADPNLQLNTSSGLLKIRSTNSDINGQLGLPSGEYLGLNLGRIGFTGSEDFCVGARFRDVRYSQIFDQFGLYVGSGSASNFRAGYLFSGQRSLFSAQNNGGYDASSASAAGPSEGSDLFVSIGRLAGQYFFDVNGLSLTLGAQPNFLNGFTDLNVGLFAANARNIDAKTATVDDFTVMVGPATTVPEPHSFVLTLSGLIAVAVARRRVRRV
ncbi:MAG: hypothetical protein ABI120_24125 [Gemmatimonadaceae bacterium]